METSLVPRCHSSSSRRQGGEGAVVPSHAVVMEQEEVRPSMAVAVEAEVGLRCHSSWVAEVVAVLLGQR